MSEFSENKLLMGFWDHIEDLRQMILQILCVISIGFIIILWFYQPIFQLLTASLPSKNSPIYKQVLHKERVLNSSNNPINYQIPDHAIAFPNTGSWQVGPNSYQIESGAYLDYEFPLSTNKLLILGPIDGMTLTFKLGFWTSLAFTSPIWIYFILQFILPGLKENETQLLIPFILFSFLALISGIMFAYFITIPLASQYLASFNATIGVNEWTLTQYISYTLVLFAGHIIALELCLMLFLLVHFNWVSTEWLQRKRRYTIVCAFILGALLTPPDVLSQLMLALPLIGVYELAILYGKIRERFYYQTPENSTT